MGGIIVFFSLLFFLLQTSKIQQYIANSFVSDLSKKINAEITIGSVEYKFFNNISINEVLIPDLQGDTLLYIENLNANFNFFQFFNGKMIFYHAQIDGLHGNIIIDENQKTNFSFIVDAFSNQEQTNKSFDFEYFIKEFVLKKSELSITNNSKQSYPTKELAKNQIDFTKLHFKNIYTQISIDVFNKDTFSINIQDFSTQESSGFKLTGFDAKLLGSNTNLNIPYIDVCLPNSHLQLEDITLKYDSLPELFRFSDKVHFTSSLRNSNVTLRDISAFVPEFEHMNAKVQLTADLKGSISNLSLNNIGLKYGNTFRFNASLNLNGLPDIKQTFVYGNIKELSGHGIDIEAFISDLIQEQFKLPKEIKNLGLINYQGNITGFFSELVLYGNLKTGIGKISTDILVQFENNFKDLKYNGTIKSNGLNMGTFLNNKNLGNMSFYFNTKGERKMNSPLTGVIEASVSEMMLNDYIYRDIQFEGEYYGGGFNGKMEIEDENINASFNGLIDLTGKLPLFNFDLTVDVVNLYALKLTEKYPDLLFSFNTKTNMVGNSLDNINGFIRFDSINIINKNDSLNIDKIIFSSFTEENYTNFSIESEYINGSIFGSFKYSTLTESATQILREYLPSIDDNKKKKSKNNHINIDLAIENAEKISDILELSYAIEGKSTIKGYINDQKEIIDVVTNIPKIHLNERNLNNTMLHVWGTKEKLEFIVESNIPSQNDFWNFSLYATAKNDILTTDIEWRNKQKIINRGEFKTSTSFSREDKNLFAHTSILPTEVIISDLLWKIEESSIDFLPNNSFVFNDFRFGNTKQYLSIDGAVSKNKQDSINIKLKDIDLSYISMLANMTGFTLGGKTTGRATFYGLLEKPVFNTSLFIKDLEFNNKRMGDASAFATWDEVNNQLLAIAEIKDGNTQVAIGECTYIPKNNKIDINIDAKWVNIHFLTRYFEKVLPNTKAYATGHLHIGGPLNAIRFDGRLKAHEGEINVGVLGTKYTLNDSIILTPTSIEFPNITAYDQDNNKVNVNGALTHNGNFKNFKYNISVNTTNALIMDLKAGTTDFLFGKAYGNANVRITGDDDIVNIRVDAITKPGSKVYFQTVNTSSATDAGFIHYVQHEKEDEKNEYILKKVAAKQNSSTNLILNLQLEITPDADIEYIFDPVGGDMIAGRGKGNVRVEYDDNQSDVKMYGSYEIDNGKYLFTLQDVFRKEFRIERGSNIQWAGSPNNAQVNIRAIYPVTASLKDLIEEELLSTVISDGGRTSVPVNCILILTGSLLSPTVQFDIELPNNDESVKQLVRSVINTEEMMTNQILYLLVFNKFYTLDHARADNNVLNIGANEFMSLASSTVSAQLNRLVSQFFQNNTFSIGVGWRKADENDMEYQVDLQYQPNERWVINGNLGYRENNAVIENLNQFITDIDIEYLLTQSGKLRIKAYNHTIDRSQAQLKNAKNTQGVGLMYKEDFDSFVDIFRYYWKLITNIGKKDKNEKTEQTQDTDSD